MKIYTLQELHLIRGALSVFGLIVLVLIGACSQQNSEEDRTLRRGINGDPETLDPHRFSSTEAGHILRDLGEGLTAYSPGGELIGGVAESWNVSSDGKTYTFNLRKNARWSNGDVISADDFVFAFQRLLDPETGATSSKFLGVIENALEVSKGELGPKSVGVLALSSNILEIRLENATPYFLQLLTHPSTFPIHKGSVESSYGYPVDGDFISNGAYMLVEKSKGALYKIRRNPEYWNDRSTWFDEVEYHVLADEVEVLRFRAGELDITGNVSANHFQKVKTELSEELKVSPALGVYYYGFNLEDDKFSDNIALRKALSLAIDREILAEKVVGRGELPAYSWVPPGVAGFDSQSLDFARLSKEDREKYAKELYVSSGYDESKPLEVEILYNTLGGHEKVALAIQSMWREVLGIEAKLINQEFQVMLSNIRQKNNTEVFRLSWSADYNDSQTFLQLFESDNPQNLTGYRNSEVDDLLKRAATELDLAARSNLLEQAESLALADHPVIPLYFYVTKHLVAADIVGWFPMPLDYHYSRHLSRN